MDSLLRRAEAISKPGINESLFEIENMFVLFKFFLPIGTPGPLTISNSISTVLSRQFSGLVDSISIDADANVGNLVSLNRVYMECYKKT